MEITTNEFVSNNYVQAAARTPFLKRFMKFCKNQEKNRLMWLGIALAGHGCVLTPITIMAVLLAGTNFVLLMAALVAMAISLVTNLAAMPTKITIPAFILSIIIDIAIIIACFAIGLDISNTYI